MRCWIELYSDKGALEETLSCVDPIHALTIIGSYAAQNNVFDFKSASCWLTKPEDKKPQEQWFLEIK